MRRGLTISDATRTLRPGPTDLADRPITVTETALELESVPPPPKQVSSLPQYVAQRHVLLITFYKARMLFV